MPSTHAYMAGAQGAALISDFQKDPCPAQDSSHIPMVKTTATANSISKPFSTTPKAMAPFTRRPQACTVTP